MTNFPSSTTVVTVVVLAIIVALTAIALVWPNRAPFIWPIQERAQTGPHLQKILSRGTGKGRRKRQPDTKPPRTECGIEQRIRELRTLNRQRFVIVGGVYLDVTLEPIDVTQLDDREFYNLDTIRTECGGSACYVGRYLFQHHHQTSDLFSRIGSGDRFSVALRALLRQEDWIRTLQLSNATDVQCGVSVHLLQHDRSFHTTFTHLGSLASLDWSPILDELERTTRPGGVLYISSYFRTNLCRNLSQTLRNLSPKLLICIDHGRFIGGKNQDAEMALINAFSEQLIDVYISTYDEIRELMGSTGIMVDDSLSPRDALEIFGKQRALPPITVVRNAIDQKASVFVLLDGSVTHMEGLAEHYQFNAPVGSKSAFNAAFVNALSTSPQEFDLPDTVDYAMKQALSAWAPQG